MANILDILNHHGIANQSLKAIEEMAELTKELCKWNCYMRAPIEVQKHLREEIADVLITIYQLKEHFGSQEIDEIIDFKINRTLERL